MAKDRTTRGQFGVRAVAPPLVAAEVKLAPEAIRLLSGFFDRSVQVMDASRVRTELIESDLTDIEEDIDEINSQAASSFVSFSTHGINGLAAGANATKSAPSRLIPLWIILRVTAATSVSTLNADVPRFRLDLSGTGDMVVEQAVRGLYAVGDCVPFLPASGKRIIWDAGLAGNLEVVDAAAGTLLTLSLDVAGYAVPVP